MITPINKIAAYVGGKSRAVGYTDNYGMEVEANKTEEVLEILADKLNELIGVVNKLEGTGNDTTI